MPIGNWNDLDLGLFDYRIVLLRIPCIIINVVNYRCRNDSTSRSNYPATRLVRSHRIDPVRRHQRFPHCNVFLNRSDSRLYVTLGNQPSVQTNSRPNGNGKWRFQIGGRTGCLARLASLTSRHSRGINDGTDLCPVSDLLA